MNPEIGGRKVIQELQAILKLYENVSVFFKVSQTFLVTV